MDNTRFSNIAYLLAEFYIEYQDSPEYAGMFRSYDLGFIYSVAHNENHAVLTASGRSIVEQTWQLFCEAIGLDHYSDFDSLDEMMELIDE